eukprot:TRINITY_DN6639_c0_g1_i4.p1 TRINITY_DN6639_c0_g1~~TRINITY_DN6639_c0_g1_i4.p1  ORF type:complete len:488 (+),score=61.05 TRINITY_DN6639_c0_g1_i4:83-1546(+)
MFTSARRSSLVFVAAIVFLEGNAIEPSFEIEDGSLILTAANDVVFKDADYTLTVSNVATLSDMAIATQQSVQATAATLAPLPSRIARLQQQASVLNGSATSLSVAVSMLQTDAMASDSSHEQRIDNLHSKLSNLSTFVDKDVHQLRSDLSFAASNLSSSLTASISAEAQARQLESHGIRRVFDETANATTAALNELGQTLSNAIVDNDRKISMAMETCENKSASNEAKISHLQEALQNTTAYAQHLESRLSHAEDLLAVNRSFPCSSFANDWVPDFAATFNDAGNLAELEAANLVCLPPMDENDRPWLVFQQRVHADVDFYQPWSMYRQGFGVMNPRNSFWMGNKLLNALTGNGQNWRLRVELESMVEHDRAHALFETFRVGTEAENFKLTAQGYSGTAGDSLTYASGYAFSTYDKDNDIYGENCASLFKGGWWYTNCHGSNLNGLFFEGGFYSGNDGPLYAQGTTWWEWKSYDHSLRSWMAIQPPA